MTYLEREGKKEKEKAANTNSNLKKPPEEGKKNHISVHKSNNKKVLFQFIFIY